MFLFVQLCLFFFPLSSDAASVEMMPIKAPMNESDFHIQLLEVVEREKEKYLHSLGISNIPSFANVTVPAYMDHLWELANSANATRCSENETESKSGACRDAEKARHVAMVVGLSNRDYSDEATDFRERLRFHTPSIVSRSDVSSAELRVFRCGSLAGSGVDHWAVFDVSGAAQEWVKHPKGQFELELHVELTNKTRVTPASVGLKKYSNNSETGTIVVVFQNGVEKEELGSLKIKRSQSEWQNYIEDNLSEVWYRTRNHMMRKDKICQLREFYIDFRLLKWNNIIRPLGYQACVCSGMCPFTLSNNMNASHHARIQNIMHHNYPDVYPPVACVPVDLTHLMVLYHDQNGDVKLRRLPGMIATSCGCQ
ncbi:protein DVR-1 homolog [Corticium candelabrum]|uniref:protein DVR-1 homolog n=1 Tax=Corticium candelabrum TaxID=121492 RepID=UPI002E275ED8|nr:protein DVR-1 homolog [Corticium candelabrum]